MANLYADYQSLIKFVSANKDQDRGSGNSTSGSQLNNDSSLAGDEARAFYETLVKQDRNQGKKKSQEESSPLRHKETGTRFKRQKTRQNSSHQKTDPSLKAIKVKEECDSFECVEEQKSHPENLLFTDIELLRDSHRNLLLFAQNGELAKLKKLFESKTYVDINFQDRFGWTALMCSCVGKHRETVEFLLSKGADRTILNTAGKNAADLCADIHAFDLRDTLYLYDRNRSIRKSRDSEVIQIEEFHCEVCKTNFKETTRKAHLSSTVHIFNLKLKPKTDTFMIPETNVGYRLMKRAGWDGEGGLGPDADGQKYPVKTVLKRDRACIGAKSSKDTKAKVTHFGPHDKTAIQTVSSHKHSERVMSVRTASRKARQRQVQKDKAWEHKLRLNMNME